MLFSIKNDFSKQRTEAKYNYYKENKTLIMYCTWNKFQWNDFTKMYNFLFGLMASSRVKVLNG